MRHQSSGLSKSRSRQARGRAWVSALVCALMMAGASPVFADEYDSEGSHPVRIIAYVLHPVGVVLDFLIFRPAHWIGSQEPFKTVFGHED